MAQFCDAVNFLALFFKHFWLVCILSTCANAAVWRWRSRKHIAIDPSLRAGYATLIQNFLIWGNLAWIVMGISILSGATNSIFDYFRPQDFNPHVVTWIGLVLAEQGLLSYWLLAKDGAKTLTQYPGLFTLDIGEGFIRILAFLIPLAGILFIVGAILMDLPIEEINAAFGALEESK